VELGGDPAVVLHEVPLRATLGAELREVDLVGIRQPHGRAVDVQLLRGRTLRGHVSPPSGRAHPTGRSAPAPPVGRTCSSRGRGRDATAGTSLRAGTASPLPTHLPSGRTRPPRHVRDATAPSCDPPPNATASVHPARRRRPRVAAAAVRRAVPRVAPA